MPIPECVQVQTTAGSEEEAGRIADVLLGSRLAACVQVIGPIRSRYWWRGELEEAEEWLCVAKTTSGAVDAVVEAIAGAHSYETPEIVAVPVTGGSEAYLSWLAGEVRPPGPEGAEGAKGTPLDISDTPL